MSKPARALAVLTLVVVAALTGCSSPAATEDTPPVSLSPVPGTELKQVQLTAEAVDRLQIKTEPVAASGSNRTVPYAAVVYGTDGSTWAFVQKSEGTYLREPLQVTQIQGTTAVLSDGPQVGTPVVVVGAAELLGAEYEISGEQ